ncbi:carboxylesterase [Actinoplanes sp. L3-i22]|uniref:alpha/beta hydrolase n=1 Tax=Actinoplanes sp. L3-i22 TaxID=2836373 RepID=UPI001C77FF79|nr:alpha/beta fold hydrolase [Actinoplanes sp. L3-i22]BCY08207.1 hypothetical protein L3i22_032950 [Actinoplanes sp. L3-i22]
MMDTSEREPSRLLSHGGRTARAVLLLHGYTHDPSQFAGLGAELFARGYNVFIPRAPGHGLPDAHAHRSVTRRQLTTYGEEALDLVKTLGDEVGIAGISGGAVLAARLATRRDSEVRRLLLLAPFFRPSPAQAPAALIDAMTVLYGRGLLPDRITTRGYSLRAVAQYLALARTIRPRNARLDTLAMVLSRGDTVVDPRRAIAVATRLAGSSGIPLTLESIEGAGHDVLKVPGSEKLYADLYEGRPGHGPGPHTGATTPSATAE